MFVVVSFLGGEGLCLSVYGFVWVCVVFFFCLCDVVAVAVRVLFVVARCCFGGFLVCLCMCWFVVFFSIVCDVVCRCFVLCVLLCVVVCCCLLLFYGGVFVRMFMVSVGWLLFFLFFL